MKRKDIRKYTIYIIVFCAVAFIAMCVYYFIPPKQESGKAPAEKRTVWSDTLTNRSSEHEPLYPMDKDVERFMAKWDIKGMQLAVSRNDSLLFAKGYGMANAELGVPMEATTVTRIASASKLVTAAAVMKLVEDRKLSLDSKVFGEGGILDSGKFREATADKRVNDITVGNLLRHQGGFTLGAGDPMFNTVEIIKAKRLNHVPAGNELIEIVLKRRLGFTPGAGRRYSNFGYYLLSRVIEKVTGKGYWDYVKENILEPAGCYDFMPATNYYEERGRDESRYYSPDAELVEEFNNSGRMVDRCYGGANIRGLMGAGGWVTSAADFCRFVATIDGDPTVPDIISPASVALMTAHGEKSKESLGWTDSDGKGKWTRSGTLSSAHALVVRYPDGECWVMTTNTGVWTGFHFTHSMQRLIDTLRSRYSERFPTRNLWAAPTSHKN